MHKFFTEEVRRKVGRFAFLHSINFGLYEQYRRFIHTLELPYGTNFLSGSAAGLSGYLIVFPLDFSRGMMRNIKNPMAHKTQWEAAKITFQTLGIRGFYTHFGNSWLGVTLYRGIYFSMYPHVKVCRFIF